MASHIVKSSADDNDVGFLLNSFQIIMCGFEAFFILRALSYPVVYFCYIPCILNNMASDRLRHFLKKGPEVCSKWNFQTPFHRSIK